MFISKLNAAGQSLTEVDKKIADYILNHFNEAKTITSLKLAQSTQVAQASIIRFSKKLGYQSFREMLADLSAENEKEWIEEEIETHEETGITLKKIALQMQDIVDLTVQYNEEAKLLEAAELIKKAKENILFGVGSSNLFAHYFSEQLNKLGIPCFVSMNAHTVFMKIEQADENCTLVLISETGKSEDVLKAASLAKQRGLKIISMTRSYRNPLHDLSTIVLKTVCFETLTRLNVTTMRTSQLYLIDALYLLIMKSDFDYYNRKIERAEQLTGRKNK